MQQKKKKKYTERSKYLFAPQFQSQFFSALPTVNYFRFAKLAYFVWLRRCKKRRI